MSAETFIKKNNVYDARRKAHKLFDRLWKPKSEGGIGLLTRANAYRELRIHLKKDRENGHISMLNKRECYILINKMKEWGLG